MKTRYVVWYLLLVALPTAIVGSLASRWARHEDTRLRRLAGVALEEQAVIMAGHLDLLAREIADGLLDALTRPADDEADALRRLRAEHPLVRNVFLWTPAPELIVPDSRWADDEERAFVVRYDALFSGRRQWPVAPDELPVATPTSPALAANVMRQEAQRQTAQRRGRSAPVSRASDHAGWLPWFWERDLHLLGWARSPADGRIRGAEMEFMALLARFQSLFQRENDVRIAFALSDHNGDILMRERAYDELVARNAMTVAVPVSALLPQWQVRAAALPAVGGIPFAPGSVLLIAILLIAILAGGALLAGQGYRHQRDATRKTTFVSNVSHELRTPLTTIRMYAEMLREGRVRDGAKRNDYLDTIVSESRRLTRLIGNVLDFGRLEQRKRTYRAERFDAAALLRDLAAGHEDRLREAGMRLRLELPDEPVEILCDRDALEQAALNLLDNAAKYAETGGEAHIALARGDDDVRIAVSDRGPGVPRDHVRRIFRSFHRADDSLSARVPGTGLGLSIARRLMRAQGGDVLYRPRHGGGATFEIRIPAK